MFRPSNHSTPPTPPGCFRTLVFLFLLSASVLPLPAQQQSKTRASLIAESPSIQPGIPFTVAVQFTIAPHWHTYWRNPGDSGLATSLAWDLPPGFSASGISWPHPQRIAAFDLTSYGYEDEVLHLVTITPPADLPAGGEVTLKVHAEWLECEKICVPGEAALSLALPVRDEPPAPGPHAAEIARARAKLPGTPDGWQASASRSTNSLNLTLTPPPGAPLTSTAQFFPYEDIGLDHTQPAKLDSTAKGYAFTQPLKPDAAFERINGVLVSPTGWEPGGKLPAWEVDLPLQAAATTPAASAAGPFLPALLLGFVGGLILNLMPCVFPVLGLKIMGFVKQSGQDPAKVVRHGLVFTAGVLLSFWLVAGLLMVLRAGGQDLGWGFQLQSPAFVFVLTLFLFLFGLNMAGLFEFGASAVGVGAGLTAKSSYTGSFFSGVLATVVATPCAAPFLAPALGTALALPPLPSLALFTSIGLGLSSPYLILSARPSLVRLLPKPGAWMETFKQFMAFPLFATAAFLVWVLEGQLGETQLLRILFALVMAALAGWIHGRFSGYNRSPRTRVFSGAVALLLLAGSVFYGWPSQSNGPHWEPWSPQRLEQLRAGNRTVYVDFTARWCATCQTNKLAVFSSKEVLAELDRRRVALLKADWTNRDPAITRELASWGRSAVPFNLLYLPGRPEPTVLPELLTPRAVLEALGSAPP